MLNKKLNDAVEVLQGQLEEQVQQVVVIKKTINALRVRMGEEPLFSDVSVERLGSMQGRPDQFYGKPLATAVGEYLEWRKQACTSEEILGGLEQGGFDFRSLRWSDNDRLRSLAIYLVKNTKTFHRLPNRSFGLLAWYDQVTVKAGVVPAKGQKPKRRKKRKRKKREKVVETPFQGGAPEELG